MNEKVILLQVQIRPKQLYAKYAKFMQYQYIRSDVAKSGGYASNRIGY